MKFVPLLFALAAVSCVHPNPHTPQAHHQKRMALLEKFDRFDYNGNGKLTRREIEQGVRESDVQGVDARELDAAMKFYDVNKDGSISRWEAEHAVTKPLPAHP
jgi:Ca2+-binding EF-hand superfamily protein